MDEKELRDRIRELPEGYISRKKINGKEYAYYQWRQDGKLKSRYLHADEVDYWIKGIEERKGLESELRLLLIETKRNTNTLKDAQKFLEYNRRNLGSRIALGEQDYDDLINRHNFYVDKTLLIKEWWESEDAVTLITRPRRFGKTLTVSMLECFFSVKYANRADLFENQDIWRCPGFRKLQGTYPVIRITFADIAQRSYEELERALSRMMATLLWSFHKVTESEIFSDYEREEFISWHRALRTGQDPVLIRDFLPYLSHLLFEAYGKKVLIFIDEYDTPLQEAYTRGYWKEAIDLFRTIFQAALKTNPDLDRAFLTGITRISKESLFSGLNHLGVYSVFSNEYGSYFGFTEQEVFTALQEQKLDQPEIKRRVKECYDGFTFGKYQNIYNPWSITYFLKTHEFKPYWANTSSNKLVGTLFAQGSNEMKQQLGDLIEGRTLDVEVEETLVYSDLQDRPEAVWGLLLGAGYLTFAEKLSQESYLYCKKSNTYRLRATNLEVRRMLGDLVHDWFQDHDESYRLFLRYLLRNDTEGMNYYMNRMARHVFSVFDAPNHETAEQEPERFYHGFVLGLLVDLSDQYLVRSNRESGFGRYDVMLIPRNLKKQDGSDTDAYILEFKVMNSGTENTLEETAQRALRQIEDKKYAEELSDLGVAEQAIHKYGFAFRGKEIRIDGH